MIRSMTGFGRGESRTGRGVITAEIKTVNHKFFEVSCKLPGNIADFEERVKQLVQRKVRRGKVNLSVSCDGVLAGAEEVSLNLPIAKSYYGELAKLKKALRLGGTVSVEDLILFPGVLNYQAKEADLSRQWPKIKQALDRALDKLVSDREKEGRALYRDLTGRANRIKTMLSVVSRRAASSLDDYRKKFADRVRKLTGSQEIDPNRLAMEVAIHAKNCDITEEIIRLKNHLGNFKKTIENNGGVGKKLDFIAQELHREINTIGAKASDFKISNNVINIKSEIEKIREQVKNIE
ncbi:MAG: YicC/YloC family endoribonuclease [Candidatus Omnitrophota bacterium]